jgi:hypothetical protein
MFAARGVTKVDQMGEVTVHGLRGVDLDVVAGEFVVLLASARRPCGSTRAHACEGIRHVRCWLEEDLKVP